MADAAPGPVVAVDEVTFGWAPHRLIAATLALGLLGAVIGPATLLVVFGLLYGHVPTPTSTSWLLAYVPFYAFCFAGFSVLFARARPPWLRVGTAGVELAATRTDPVFIPWSVVSFARFRRRGPWTVLEITVSDPATVFVGQRGGRRPRPRRQAGRVSFVVDVGVLRAGTAVIRSELARRGCTVGG